MPPFDQGLMFWASRPQGAATQREMSRILKAFIFLAETIPNSYAIMDAAAVSMVFP
jgi:hypothetical protein